MIRLLTGAPGSGKTLRMIWHMREYQNSFPDRPVYQHGIDGFCFPGVQTLDDAHNWQSCPDGSVIIIDEAQEVFRSRAGFAEIPDYLKDLEKHRHRGIDFILTTQHPAFIHSHIRRLNPEHEHLVAFGRNTARVFDWPEVNDNPSASRDTSGFKLWNYPRELYKFYRSATLHTKSKKIPRLLKRIIILSSAAFVLFAAAFFLLYRGRASSVRSPSSGSSAPASSSSAHLPSATSYAMRFVPRIASKPWSAPAWDGRKVQSDPQLYCIEVSSDTAIDCRCFTEQVTHVDLPQAVCRRVVEQGNYNPYEPPVSTSEVPSTVAASPSRYASGSAVRPSSGQPDSDSLNHPVGIPTARYVPPEYGKWDSDPFGPIKRN